MLSPTTIIYIEDVLSPTTMIYIEDVPTFREIAGVGISRVLRQASPWKTTFLSPSFLPALPSPAAVYCRCPGSTKEGVGSSGAVTGCGCWGLTSSPLRNSKHSVPRSCHLTLSCDGVRNGT